ncbi:MAG: beta-glucosidase, partial [Caulobacteraceae bacterium]|nr:beta-glucosidase [Caulobacteraceae bacterium]
DFGAVIGDETRREGFNVSLGGGVDLQRDPRGGRAFEYHGEDPVLAGRIVAAELRGVEDEGVVATIKHYAFNDIETGRMNTDVRMDERSMREAELLAFEIGIKESGVGAVMCSYNLVGGLCACEDPYLLNEVLKTNWGYRGWVMSDRGATHSTVPAALAGLDQEFFSGQYFGPALKAAVERGEVPQSRLDDMVTRILSQLIRVGAFDRREAIRPIDPARGAQVAQRVAEAGSVLLKNEGVLPLSRTAKGTIAVIGFHADVGVLTGGGSAQVNPVGGNALTPAALRAGGQPGLSSSQVWVSSSPLAAIKGLAKDANVIWDPGIDPASAARAAATADTVILFAGRQRSEGADIPDLTLGNGQEDLIAAVAKANPRTVVVLETGGAHTMPWLGSVKGVLEAWYPGQKGGDAIANLLFGVANPSGKLPLTFPMAEADLARPASPVAAGRVGGTGPAATPASGAVASPIPLAVAGAGGRAGVSVPRPVLNYDEGPLLGYKWFDAKDKKVLFPFGFGLSYTTFGYASPTASFSGAPSVTFELSNTGKVAGAEAAQVYVEVPGSGAPRRLAGWARVNLGPGARQRVVAQLEPRALANWDVARKRWVMPAGAYAISIGSSSRDLRLKTEVKLLAERLIP